MLPAAAGPVLPLLLVIIVVVAGLGGTTRLTTVPRPLLAVPASHRVLIVLLVLPPLASWPFLDWLRLCWVCWGLV